MKTKLLSIIITPLALLLFLPAQANAAIRADGEHVIVETDETIDDDLYAAGETVTIRGTVNGDVYAAAGLVNVSGTINGDLIAAGGTITVSSATISEDLRIAGGNIVVSETQIGDSLSSFGGNITISGGSIGGGVNFASGTNVINTLIGRGLVGGGGVVSLDSPVGRDVFIGAGSLSLGSKAIINGDINYSSEQEADINSDAQITGNINYNPIEDQRAPDKEQIDHIFAGMAIGFKVWAFLSTLLAGAILLKLFPKSAQDLSALITKQPVTALGWGLLKLLLIIPLLILLLITIIGIPLSLITFLVFLIEAYLTKIIVSLAAGDYLNQKLKLKQKNRYLIYTLGLFILALLGCIPILGGIVSFVGFLFGLGAIFQYKISLIKKQK